MFTGSKNIKYELILKLANNKTNWKLKPLTVTYKLLTEWTDLFTNYIKKVEIPKPTKTDYLPQSSCPYIDPFKCTIALSQSPYNLFQTINSVKLLPLRNG